jgi:uncharacterized protein YegL
MSDDFENEMPGGPMANRPVNFFWLLDRSYSMEGSKITALNFAVREALPEMRTAAESNPAAELMVRAMTFSNGAKWHDAAPIEVHSYSWSDISCDGGTDMGAAFHLVAQELTDLKMPERALRPVLALVSDGQPTDDYRAGLRSIDATPWGQRAVRAAIAVGADADNAMLQEFLGNRELKPILVHNANQLAAAIRWVSTAAVKAASNASPAGGGAAGAGQPWQPSAQDDDEDVW